MVTLNITGFDKCRKKYISRLRRLQGNIERDHNKDVGLGYMGHDLVKNLGDTFLLKL